MINERISKMLATFFYAGYCPVAPGTLATLLGAGIVYSLRWHFWLYILVMVAVIAVGFLSSGPAEKAIGRKDPGCIVIDEVAGIMVSFFMLPMYWPVIVAGFFLFRAFDMFKIPPADRFEAMGGGRGIMLDDLAAGVYTNIILQIALRLSGVFY